MSRDKLIENIFKVMPLFNKKLFKDFRHNKSIHQMQLVFCIYENNGKPMKYFCDKLMIPKSHLSKIVNRLIEDELIERKIDENDRRVINLYITKKGEEKLKEHHKVVKSNVKAKLEKLDNNDIKILSKNLEEIEIILKKL